MSQTLQQIFVANPKAVFVDTDIFYGVSSPYTPGSDFGYSWATLKSKFLQPVNNLNDVASVVNSRANLGVPSLTGFGASGTWAIDISGNAATATTSTNATNTTITDDTTTNATVFPTWVTASAGNLPEKVSSTKLTFNPSTGLLTTTALTASLAGSTGLPISTGVSGLGAGVATFLATPTSANLATAVTGETGTGALVFGTAPTISQPLINAIFDQTFNTNVMQFVGTASAVNHVNVVNGATTGAVGFQFDGTDANVNAVYTTKGIGTHSFFNELGGSGGPILTLTAPLSNANGVTVTGAAASGNVSINGTGTDSNIQLRIGGKGTGATRIMGDNGAHTIASFAPVASAVNNLQFFPSVAASAVRIAIAGTDTNVTMTLDTKGTGGVLIKGTGTNDLALTGYMGEFVSSVISSGAPVNFTTAVSSDLTSVSLTAGDWDLYGNIHCSATTVTQGRVWISATSATQPDRSLYNMVVPVATSTLLGLSAPFFRASLSATTTIYISGFFGGTGTLACAGGIFARRVR